jgi:hypothetical protein
MHTKFWLENLKERDHSEDLGVDGKLYEHNNEPSGSIRDEFLDWLNGLASQEGLCSMELVTVSRKSYY